MSNTIPTFPPAALSGTIDPAEFRDDLEPYGLTPDEEKIFLETLWHIVTTIVDAGFGIEAASAAIPALTNSALQAAFDEVELEDTTNARSDP